MAEYETESPADNTWSIDGIHIEAGGLSWAATELLRRAGEERRGADGLSVRLVNSYTFPLAASDPDYRQVIAGPGWNLPDGTPLRWLARTDGYRIGTVRGPTLFEEVLRRSARTNVRHYLLGGTPQALSALQRAIVARFPECEIVGGESPPFRPMSKEELRQQDERILASKADIVWVGTGTPRQDYETRRLAASYGLIAVGVGAAFDFSSGQKRAAPRPLHGTGLEWLFRLVTEPRRLWRRYLAAGLWVAARLMSRAASFTSAYRRRRVGHKDSPR